MDPKSPEELQEHMLRTYYGLRTGLFVIGLLLPLIIALTGWSLHGVWLEPSISDYYHSDARLRDLTTRDLFVGCLLAVGVCLYLYKGYSDRENVALNLAGVFAVPVALLPTHDGERDAVAHLVVAVLFFPVHRLREHPPLGGHARAAARAQGRAVQEALQYDRGLHAALSWLPPRSQCWSRGTRDFAAASSF